MVLGRWIERLRGFDWVVLGTTILLVAVGHAILFSVTLNVEQPHVEKFYRQLTSFGIGLALLFFFASIDFRLVRSSSWLLYALGALSLIAVLVLGKTVRGTTGWFSFFGSSFQPVELVKIVLVVALARYFADRFDQGASWRIIGHSAFLTVVPTVLVLRQPDVGSAILLIASWLGLLLFLRMPLRRLVVIIVGVFVVGALSWFTLKDYQRDRILTFINPNRDPLRSSYNVRQAIVAVGSGKIVGRGLGFGTQSQLNFLPTQDTDFIFAVLAEELGFVGVVLLLALFTVFLLRLVRGIAGSRDVFGGLLLAGFVTLFGSEIVLNIGGNIGILPITGTPLPFLSFGGSALISSMAAVGLCLSVISRR